MATQPADGALTIKDVCKLLKLSAPTIHRYRAAGKIPSIQPAGKGGAIRFPLDLLERMNAKNSTAESAEPTRSHETLAGQKPKWLRDSTSSA